MNPIGLMTKKLDPKYYDKNALKKCMVEKPPNKPGIDNPFCLVNFVCWSNLSNLTVNLTVIDSYFSDRVQFFHDI